MPATSHPQGTSIPVVFHYTVPADGLAIEQWVWPFRRAALPVPFRNSQWKYGVHRRFEAMTASGAKLSFAPVPHL
jgi:hypothetical protein